jgi:hypothetical protein
MMTLEHVCICIGKVIRNLFIIIGHILGFTQQTELHYKDILIYNDVCHIALEAQAVYSELF